MKIGTITVHNGYNYGASLQAYALVEYLRSLNQEAYLIDYRNQRIENLQINQRKTNWNNRHELVRNIKKTINSRALQKMDDKYHQFHQRILDNNHLNIQSNEQLESLTKEYDAFICGSDQIWSSSITGGDIHFFLDFAWKKKMCISYAASVGGKRLDYNSEQKRMIGGFLKDFKALSVREKVNVDEMEEIAGKHCSVVLDPTLLLESKQWEKIANEAKIKRPFDHYVIYYQVLDDDSFYPKALDFAKKRGLPLVRMDWHPSKARVNGCVSVSAQGIGPCEFLNLFLGADFVLSNSFHGTVFALMFEKDFMTYTLNPKHAGKGSRIEELLERVGLDDRVRCDLDDTMCARIDWLDVKMRLSQHVMESKKYLSNALEI